MIDLYRENYKTLHKEIKINIKNGKDILSLQLEDLILLRCKYYPSNLQIQCNSYQNPSDIFFAKIKKKKPILKFTWHPKGPQIDKTILTKNKAEGLTLPVSEILQSYSYQNSVVRAYRQTDI